MNENIQAIYDRLRKNEAQMQALALCVFRLMEAQFYEAGSAPNPEAWSNAAENLNAAFDNTLF